MSLHAVKMLGINITTDSKEKVLEYIQKYLGKSSAGSRQLAGKYPKALLVVTPNPEQVMLAQEDTAFRGILNRADVAIPDGIGILFSLRFLGHSFVANRNARPIARIPGVELLEDLAGIASERGFRIGLIGGRPGVAVKALECLQVRYPGLQGFTIEGFEVGSRGEEGKDTKVLRYKDTKSNEGKELQGKSVFHLVTQYLAISRSPLLVFVGLGAPKQEFFIDALRKTLEDTKDIGHSLVLMAVGGSFDILAGRIPRAPLFMRSMGFEWVWRLFAEPWRWKRQLSLLRFIFLVLRTKFQKT